MAYGRWGITGERTNPHMPAEEQAATVQRNTDKLFDKANEFERKLETARDEVRRLKEAVGELDDIEARIQTPGAAATVCGELTLRSHTVVIVRAYVVAQHDVGTDRAGYHLEGVFYRGAGIAVQQGLTIGLMSLESNILWEADFGVNLNNVRVLVTGVAATTINWLTRMHMYEVGRP